MAASGLPKALRHRAIILGIAAAAVLRIVFAGLAQHLMQIVGMAIAGGILLLWVSWKLWREIRAQQNEAPTAAAALANGEEGSAGKVTKTLRQAIIQIFLADLSMSLDNVLAVAGAARDKVWVLVIGLGFSVVLMAFAASIIARLIHRHRWIAYVGLIVVLYVALAMIWDGTHSVIRALP
jgi:YjbE family integral membrane protein